MLLFHINFYFFSRNVKEDVAKRISEISKISVTTKLEKYLGVPSITGRVHVGLFQHVLDICNLENGNMGPLSSFPDYAKVIWPLPAWVYTDNIGGV